MMMMMMDDDDDDDDDKESLKLAMRQPLVRRDSDFTFLARAYESGWPVLSHRLIHEMIPKKPIGRHVS